MIFLSPVMSQAFHQVDVISGKILRLSLDCSYIIQVVLGLFADMVLTFISVCVGLTRLANPYPW